MDRGRTVAALVALAACFVCSAAAPMTSNQTALELLEGPKDGCYYNFQHYGENDRIMTNEPCLNCTCHNRMLMCYLRVCPFTKAIGQDCTVEKRADQCCPIVTCPDVPVDLLTSTSTSSPAEYGASGLGKPDKYGCSINGKYFSEGAKVPPSPNKPCEHCYCIRNMTTCVMQECTLHVDGCTPIYHKDVCCPVRYSCDHPEDDTLLLDDMTTTVRPTPGFLLTTTTILPVTQPTQDCIHADQIFADGALIKTEKACEHCYCMKGDIVCVVQECGTPMENEGKNCTSLPPRHGQCCPDTYICEGDEPSSELTTEIPEKVTSPPRRGGVEGSGYRNEPDESFTETLPFDNTIEGSGEENVDIHAAETPITEKIDTIWTTTETSKISHNTELIYDETTKTDVHKQKISNEEEISSSTTASNIDSEVTQGNTETIDDVKFMSSTSDYQTSSPISSVVTLDDTLTIKDTEKDKENNIIDYQKTTIPDLIEKTTVNIENVNENDLFTTKPSEQAEDNNIIYNEVTTEISDLKITKQENQEINDVTTESLEKIEESLFVDEKQTTKHDISEDGQQTQGNLDNIQYFTTESVQKDDENISYDLKKTTTSDIIHKSTQQEEFDSNDFVTTEFIDKDDQNVLDIKTSTIKDHIEVTNQEYSDMLTTEYVAKGKKDIDKIKTTTQKLLHNEELERTTIKDLIYETTSQEQSVDEKYSIATESTGIVDENINSGVEKTTIKDIVEEITYKEDFSNNNQPTTEYTQMLNNISDNDTEKTPTQEVDEKTTLKYEHLTTISNEFNPENKVSTQRSDDIRNNEQSTSTEKFSTQTSAENSKFSEVTLHEKELYTTNNYEVTKEYTTTTRENLYADKTTSNNPIENEIIEDITPTLLPSRIPGEGDCLLNSITYRNNSIVPSTNNCHTSCKCISSVIKCDPIICSPPPAYMKDCELIYDSPNSCCPTYLCNTKEATPPESHNQMSDDKKDIAASECNTSDCILQPSLTSPDCSEDKCAEKSDKNENSANLCDQESGCIEKSDVPLCEGKKCDVNTGPNLTKETEANEQSVTTDCNTESCRKPVESDLVQECSDTNCRRQQDKLDITPSLECLGVDCIQQEKVSSSIPTVLPDSGTTVKTDLDDKESQDIKPVEVNTLTNQEMVTENPTISTTLKESDTLVEQYITQEPSTSNQRETTDGPEKVTNIYIEINPTDAKLPEIDTTENSKTEIVPKIETATKVTMTATETETQVPVIFDNNDNKSDEAEYDTSTKVLHENDREESTTEKQITDSNILNLAEKETSDPVTTILSESESHVTPGLSETIQTVTEKLTTNTPLVFETENPISITSFPEHENEPNKETVTDTSTQLVEDNNKPTSDLYESTEHHEIIVGHPDYFSTESNQIHESEPSEQLTTPANIKESETTAITRLEYEIKSEYPTTVETTKQDYTKSNTEIEAKPTETPVVFVTVKDNENANHELPSQPVSSYVEETTQSYTSTKLPYYTSSDEKVTVTPQELDLIHSHTESNDEAINNQDVTTKDVFSPEPSPIYTHNDTPTILDKDEISTDISDIEIKQPDITSTPESNEIVTESDKEITVNNFESDHNGMTTTFDKNEVVTEQLELQTTSNESFDANKDTENDENGYNDLTTPNTLLTTQAQSDLHKNHDIPLNHIEQTTNDDSAITENIVSITKEQLLPFTNAPQDVEKTQTEIITTEKKEETPNIEEITTQKIISGYTDSEFLETGTSTLKYQEHNTDIPKVTEILNGDAKPSTQIFEITTDTNLITTESASETTQHEHQTIASQEDLTFTEEPFSANKNIPTTVNIERATEEEISDINQTSLDKEQDIKSTQSIKLDDTTKATMYDSDPSNTSPNVLEFDKTESSITVDVKGPNDNNLSDKPQSHVTEVINKNQDYTTEWMGINLNQDNTDKIQTQEITDLKPMNIVTEMPNLYTTIRDEVITYESPIATNEIETKSPDLLTTYSDIISQTQTEKEYPKLPNTATEISTQEEITNSEILTSVLTESSTVKVLAERTTFNSQSSDLLSTTETSIDQTTNNIIRQDNIKSTLPEHHSTLVETPVTSTIDYHVKEQQPLEENESTTDKSDDNTDVPSLEINTEKISNDEDTTQKYFSDITTKVPAQYITEVSLSEVDISTENSVFSEKYNEILTTQSEIKTESPSILYEKLSTVDFKSTEEGGVTETILQDQKKTHTQTPETTDVSQEIITTESPQIKETMSIPVSLVTEEHVSHISDEQNGPHEIPSSVTQQPDMSIEVSTIHTTEDQFKTTSPNTILSESNDISTVKPDIETEPDISHKPSIDFGETSIQPDVITEGYTTGLPSLINSDKSDNDLLDEKTTQSEKQTTLAIDNEIGQMATTSSPDISEYESVNKESELPTDKFEDITTLSSISDRPVSEDSVYLSNQQPDSQKVHDENALDATLTTTKDTSLHTFDSTTESTEAEKKLDETTPYLIELEEHTHHIKEDITSETNAEEFTTTHYFSHSTERGDQLIYDNNKESNKDIQSEENFTENLPVTKPNEEPWLENDHKSTYKEEIPTTVSSHMIVDQESSTKYTTLTENDSSTIVSSSSITPIEEELHTVALHDTESSSPATETEIVPEKEIIKDSDKPVTTVFENVSSNEDFATSTSQSITTKVSEQITTQSIELDNYSKPEEKPAETYYTPEPPKPESSESPTDDMQPPDFPPSGGAGGYGQEPDYGEEDQTFGPGTCRYGGKVYVSAQQIPRDDPCDFCFCFRSDIICLQQSCPPPIHGCHEEPIQGFCCPRYECPVSMATAVNVTTTTTTTTTTLPPHFLPHAYKGAAQRRGCQIKGHTYKVGEVVRASSGPCLHCTCGGDGQMKCDPKVCTPEPMLRQMIAAAVSAKRRR